MTPSKKIHLIRLLVHKAAVEAAKSEAEKRGKYALTFLKPSPFDKCSGGARSGTCFTANCS